MNVRISGSSSFGRAIAFQAIGGEFEPRLPLIFLPAAADWLCRSSSGLEHPDDIGRVVKVRFLQMAQKISRRSSGVEHFLGREGVVSSILTDGSLIFSKVPAFRFSEEC